MSEIVQKKFFNTIKFDFGSESFKYYHKDNQTEEQFRVAYTSDTDAAERLEILSPYQVNRRLIRQANKDSLFMHCLPAHRGEEVTDEVIDGPQSVIWDEAENRLHIQKSILMWCFGK